jgi:hypothetical protein
MRNAILGSFAALLLALPAAAQQAPATPPQAPAAQVTGDSIDRGLVNLGMMTAHAFQCTPEAQRAEFQRMVLAFNAILLADMGGNAAFRYASAFGAGTARDVDRSFCERSLADWQRHVQANRLNR